MVPNAKEAGITPQLNSTAQETLNLKNTRVLARGIYVGLMALNHRAANVWNRTNIILTSMVVAGVGTLMLVDMPSAYAADPMPDPNPIAEATYDHDPTLPDTTNALRGDGVKEALIAAGTCATVWTITALTWPMFKKKSMPEE